MYLLKREISYMFFSVFLSIAFYEMESVAFPGGMMQFHGRQNKKKKLNSVALVRKRTIPTERPPLSRGSADFLRIEGCCVVSATGPHGR
jgi:hypothetical protein